MMTKRYREFAITAALALSVSLPSSIAFAQNDSGAKQSMKNAGSDTKDAAKDAGHGIKQGSKKAYHGTKKGAKKTATGTRNVGRRIEGKEPVPNHPQ